jgi:hypothetical protein
VIARSFSMVPRGTPVFTAISLKVTSSITRALLRLLVGTFIFRFQSEL